MIDIAPRYVAGQTLSHYDAMVLGMIFSGKVYSPPDPFPEHPPRTILVMDRLRSRSLTGGLIWT